MNMITTESGLTFPCGWVDDPAEVKAAVPRIEAIQGVSCSLSAHPLAGAADDDASVLLWLWEQAVLGSVQPSWNQKQVGSCVAFGTGRAVDDVIGTMAAAGQIAWPGAHVATEPIYGGSRVEVGGGRIRGDGSVGAWAAEWMLKWGTLLRKKYGQHDLTEYSESRCREYGSRGCPDDLEPEAKLYPVAAVVQVKSFDEAWKLLGSGYTIAVCSGQGFTSALDEGFCDPRGSWAHCMAWRGRALAKRRGRVVRAVPNQNSWADYLTGDPHFVEGGTGEKVRLPGGCFLIEEPVADRMIRQNDTWAFSDQKGFKKREPFRFVV